MALQLVDLLVYSMALMALMKMVGMMALMLALHTLHTLERQLLPTYSFRNIHLIASEDMFDCTLLATVQCMFHLMTYTWCSRYSPKT